MKSKRKFLSRTKFSRGFTLVELVVVIAVIAILSAVSVGAYFGITDNAKSSNSTTALKQFKDLWSVYSFSSDFDLNKEAEENALYFCMEYAPVNGPKHNLNYQIVSINDGTESAVSSLVKIKNQSNGRDIEANDAILFIVETEYPTWFLTCGQHIIEEGPICKSQEELVNSLKNSERIKEGQITDDFKPVIETVGKDQNGNEVRGFKHFRYDINVPAIGDAAAYTDVVYLEHNQSLNSNSQYVDAYTEIDGGGHTLNFNLTYLDNDVTKIYDKDTIVDLSKEYVISDTNKIDESIYGKYHYYVDSLDLNYNDLTNREVNLENYPICVVNAELISTTSIENNYLKWDNGWGTKKQEFTGTRYIYNLENFTTKFYSDFDTFYAKYNDNLTNTTGATFIFVGEVEVDGNYQFSENTILVLPKEKMTTQMMIDYYHNYTNINEGFVGENKHYEKGLFSGWKLEKTETLNDKGGFKLDFEKMKSRDFEVPNTDAGEYWGTIYSKLTINNNASLTFNSNSAIIIDGKLHANASNYRKRVTASDRGELTNNGTINLLDSDFVSFGPVRGNGFINVKGNSEVVELIKINDFGGGGFTAGAVSENLLPFLDYTLDGIGCSINFYAGSSLYAYGAINTGFGRHPIKDFYLFSPIEKSLFVIDALSSDRSNLDSLVATKSIIKGATAFENKVNVDFYGNASAGDVNITMNYSGIDKTLTSSQINFAISNFVFNLHNGATVNLSQENSRFEVLPSSQIIIHEGGKLIVGNNTQVAFLSPHTFIKAVERVGTGWQSNMLLTYNALSKLNDDGTSPLLLLSRGSIEVKDTAKFCVDDNLNYSILSADKYVNNSTNNTESYDFRYAYGIEEGLIVDEVFVDSIAIDSLVLA